MAQGYRGALGREPLTLGGSAPPARTGTPDKRRVFGHVVAVLASLFYATGTALAVLAYRGGANPLSVTTLRTGFALVAIFVLINATGGTLRLAGRDRRFVLALGLVLAIQSISHYVGIQRLPLALATLIFYLFPFYIALGAHLSGQDRITPGILAALAVAFCGLILVLDIGGSMEIDVLGMLFALTGGLAFSVIVLTTQPILRRVADTRAVSFHLHVTTVAVFVLACIVLDEFALPRTRTGWIAFLVVPFFYTAAVIAIYYAIAAIGSVRMSLVTNLEPVAAIVFGFVLLDQTLNWLQLGGAALVVGAVIAVRWDRPRPSTG